jgi:hypothetical protein
MVAHPAALALAICVTAAQWSPGRPNPAAIAIVPIEVSGLTQSRRIHFPMDRSSQPKAAPPVEDKRHRAFRPSCEQRLADGTIGCGALRENSSLAQLASQPGPFAASAWCGRLDTLAQHDDPHQDCRSRQKHQNEPDVSGQSRAPRTLLFPLISAGYFPHRA